MANWNDILNELKSSGSTHDVIRRKYLKKLSKITNRNIIIYYSGWLQKPKIDGVSLNDADKNGFMAVINKLDRTKGLDLIMHTPGGEMAATESLVDYLRSMFGDNIRAIIPQLSMSAGTMIACACKEIIMGKHSSIGPIDPQINGIPAHGVMEEFENAAKEIKKDNSKIPVWQPIIAKYPPAFVGECDKAISWSKEMVKKWLKEVMFKSEKNPSKKINKIVSFLSNHALTKSHARHIPIDKCKELGLKVVSLEKDPILQNAVLSVHHACIHTLSSTPAIKIIENQKGAAFIQMAQAVIVSN